MVAKLMSQTNAKDDVREVYSGQRDMDTADLASVLAGPAPHIVRGNLKDVARTETGYEFKINTKIGDREVYLVLSSNVPRASANKNGRPSISFLPDSLAAVTVDKWESRFVPDGEGGLDDVSIGYGTLYGIQEISQ